MSHIKLMTNCFNNYLCHWRDILLYVELLQVEDKTLVMFKAQYLLLSVTLPRPRFILWNGRRLNVANLFTTCTSGLHFCLWFMSPDVSFHGLGCLGALFTFDLSQTISPRKQNSNKAATWQCFNKPFAHIFNWQQVVSTFIAFKLIRG